MYSQQHNSFVQIANKMYTSFISDKLNLNDLTNDVMNTTDQATVDDGVDGDSVDGDGDDDDDVKIG